MLLLENLEESKKTPQLLQDPTTYILKFRLSVVQIRAFVLFLFPRNFTKARCEIENTVETNVIMSMILRPVYV